HPVGDRGPPGARGRPDPRRDDCDRGRHAAAHRPRPDAETGRRAMIVIDTETSEVREVSGGRGTTGGTLGALGLLVRRRLWRDRGLFAASTLIVALATLLAYAGPELVNGTIDRGASDAARAAGDDADILVTYPVGNPTGDNVNSVRGLPVQDFDASAEIVFTNVPPATAVITTD